MLGYCMEGIRLSGALGSYRQAAAGDTITEDGNREVSISIGDRIFISSVSGMPKQLDKELRHS